MKNRAGMMNGRVPTSQSYWASAMPSGSVGGCACCGAQVGMFSSAVLSATRARPGVRVADELHRLIRCQQPVERVLGVEFVVVQVDTTTDQPAGGQDAVQPAPALLRLQRTDQPAHRGAQREGHGRVTDELLYRGEAGELVTHGAVQCPQRSVRVVR